LRDTSRFDFLMRLNLYLFEGAAFLDIKLLCLILAFDPGLFSLSFLGHPRALNVCLLLSTQCL